ncbi:hypothetical protein J4231_02735 [Candidatus Woesearchaeota archaeon]|nr:hypothetical protein [Candidatus Woesearchaeota archaeon]
MAVIADACSVILLAKSTVLEELAKWKQVIITKSVHREVIEGKEKMFFDALLTEKLIKERRILVDNSNVERLAQKLRDDFGLGDGEAESIALSSNMKDKIILTDNRQGRKVAKVYNLSLVGSIDVVVALFKADRINEEKANSALRALKRFGWFEDYLIEQAFQEVQK